MNTEEYYEGIMYDNQAESLKKIIKQNSIKNIAITMLLILGVFIGIGVWYNNSHLKTTTSKSDSYTTPLQSSALQDCITKVHKLWDSTIAIAEGGTNQQPYNFDKSMLDQEINLCNQQYGN